MQLTVTTAPPCGKQPHHSVTGTHLGAIVFITLHPPDSFMLIGWITLDWLSSQWLVGCCSDKLCNITFCKLKDTSYLPKLAFFCWFSEHSRNTRPLRYTHRYRTDVEWSDYCIFNISLKLEVCVPFCPPGCGGCPGRGSALGVWRRICLSEWRTVLPL